MFIERAIYFNNGVYLPQAYVKINSLTFSYISPLSIAIVVSIYKDKSAYETSKPEVEARYYRCEGEAYNTYFSETTLIGIGVTPETQAYLWLDNEI